MDPCYENVVLSFLPDRAVTSFVQSDLPTSVLHTILKRNVSVCVPWSYPPSLCSGAQVVFALFNCPPSVFDFVIVDGAPCPSMLECLALNVLKEHGVAVFLLTDVTEADAKSWAFLLECTCVGTNMMTMKPWNVSDSVWAVPVFHS